MNTACTSTPGRQRVSCSSSALLRLTKSTDPLFLPPLPPESSSSVADLQRCFAGAAIWHSRFEFIEATRGQQQRLHQEFTAAILKESTYLQGVDSPGVEP